MTNRLLESVEQPHLKKEPPQFDVGDTVDVHTRIIEGDKERVQVFSGTVIMRKGKGINETFTVRRIVNNEGVERIFPVHSPFVAKVVVRRGGRTRRAKLFYLRDRVGKAVRLTEKRKDKRDEAQAGQAEPAAAPAKSKAKNKEEAPELAASAT
jgi:large subunit ribosomal protein L19